MCSSDLFIHSLNKTKFHKRQIIYSYSKSEYQNNDYKFNKSYFSSNNIQENTTPSFYKFQTYYNSNFNYNNIINDNNNNNESGISSLKNQIEDVQRNMTDQINQILLNIDNNNQNLNYEKRLKEMENNYKEKINNLILNKNKEIKELEKEMDKVNLTNQKIIKEISEKNKDNNIKILELTNIVNSLTDELNKKEEEIIIMKENSKRNEIENNNEIKDEKERIIKEYEKKINNILNISEHNQQKLKNVIKEKEIIIQNLINCNKNKTEEFNTFIEHINRDNQDLKKITEKSIGLAKYNLINETNN